MTICKFSGCKTYACYNFINLKPKYCLEHIEKGMINVKNRTCVEPNCRTQPSYNYEGEKIGLYCVSHAKDNMIDVRNKTCEFKDCKTQPNYNYEGKKKGIYCKTHKLDNMVDVMNKKCIKCNIKRPIFGLEEDKATHCADCKTDIMIDVNNRKCIECNIKQPIFGLVDSKATHCGDCKTNVMIDVTNKKCIECNIKRPTFGLEQDKATHCADCKTDIMIDVINRKCVECNIKIGVFALEGDKASYCYNCKSPEMVDVINDRCKANEHGIMCLTTANPKYRGYCTHCFANLFPNDPLTKDIQKKSKENLVRDYINSNFSGFQHDVPLWIGDCDCTHRRRIDHRKLIGNTLLCIETDEEQHKYYNRMDEESRYDDLMMLHGGKMIFIRFNPDKYRENNIVKNPYMKTRLKELSNEINKQINRIEKEENEDLIEIIYMYYDS